MQDRDLRDEILELEEHIDRLTNLPTESLFASFHEPFFNMG
jgi:hypothetical protein